MATTELHMLIMWEYGTGPRDVLVFTGWTPEAARQSFLNEQRELAIEDGITEDPNCDTWEAWLAAYGDDWGWVEETRYLPARS